MAPPEIRQIRERTRYRMAPLVNPRGAMKNRIQASLLHRVSTILHSFSDLFGKQGRRFLEALELPPASRSRVADEFPRAVGRSFVRHVQDVGEMDGEEHRGGRDRPPLADDSRDWVDSGVCGPRGEIGEISRFPTKQRHLRSYAGVAPVSDDSADRHGARHCSPACNHTLRWALIEAVTGALNTRGTQEASGYAGCMRV